MLSNINQMKGNQDLIAKPQKAMRLVSIKSVKVREIGS